MINIMLQRFINDFRRVPSIRGQAVLSGIWLSGRDQITLNPTGIYAIQARANLAFSIAFL